MKILFKEKLSYLQADSKGKFINNTLKLYYHEKNIKIRYTALYIYKKNGIANRC